MVFFNIGLLRFRLHVRVFQQESARIIRTDDAEAIPAPVDALEAFTVVITNRGCVFERTVSRRCESCSAGGHKQRQCCQPQDQLFTDLVFHTIFLPIFNRLHPVVFCRRNPLPGTRLGTEILIFSCYIECFLQQLPDDDQ